MFLLVPAEPEQKEGRDASTRGRAANVNHRSDLRLRFTLDNDEKPGSDTWAIAIAAAVAGGRCRQNKLLQELDELSGQLPLHTSHCNSI